MKTKMKVLSLAMSGALGLSVAGAAKADALLFPYFQQGAGVFTFLSLQSFAGSFGDFSSNTLLYTFNYDDPVSGQCTHFDNLGSASLADLVQQTVVAPGLPGGLNLPAAFGDASNPNYLTVSNTRGFLTVQDQAGEFAFFGQAIILSILDGTVAAYKGLNNPFSTSQDNFSSIFTSQVFHMMSWYPTSAVDTRWFTLITGTGMNSPFGWSGERAFFNAFGGVFDRDENFLSGLRPLNIECYETITRNDFMNAAQQAGTVSGGLNLMVNLPIAGNPATGALMVKIESKVTPAIAGSATAISMENAFPNLPY